MEESKMPPYCVHQTFDDFDEFTESARGWDIDFKQLEPGPFRSEFLHYIQGNIQFGHARINRHIEQLGDSPKGFRTFAIPAISSLRLKWCGVTLPEDSAIIFQPARGLDSVSWSDFDMFIFSIPDARIVQLCNELGCPALPEIISQSDIIRCRAGALATVRQALATVADLLKRPADSETFQRVQQEFEHTIPGMLLATLASAQKTTQSRPHRMRDAVIREITAYLDKAPGTAPKVYELCNRFNVSERTLEYAFGDHFGTTPKEYLKRRRLNQVRKILRQRPHKNIPIVDIANCCGFWHMGQLAADYRNLFGELPSETFNRI